MKGNNMNNQETSKNAISDKGQRVYLASPYTHEDKEIMAFRYRVTCRVTARLINEGRLVFSPIVHCHPIAVVHTLPRDYSFWQDYSTSFLLHWAEAVNVLCLNDWEDSIGIKDELALARKIGLSVYYIHEEILIVRKREGE